MIDHHSALIYTMVVISAADREMTDAELQTIGDTVKVLPVFRDYDLSKLPATARDCAEALNGPPGFEGTVDMIVEALPTKLHETGYALACDVAASDGHASQEELRVLEMLRHKLAVGRLPAAAIERGTKARYMRL